MKNILEAAAKNRSVQRVVYTSSSIAAVRPVSNQRFKVNSNTWNELDVSHQTNAGILGWGSIKVAFTNSTSGQRRLRPTALRV